MNSGVIVQFFEYQSSSYLGRLWTKILKSFTRYSHCMLRETQNHLFLFILIRGKFLSSGKDPFDKEAEKDQYLLISVTEKKTQTESCRRVSCL